MIENPYYLADPPDDPPPVDHLLARDRVIIGYGKHGHGMNGKDADLATYGQCIVRGVEVVDPTKGELHLSVDLGLYASVCIPELEVRDGETDNEWEKRQETFGDSIGELVCTYDELPCEWTGDDWCFHTDCEVKVPISVDELEMLVDENEQGLLKIQARAAEAIYAGPRLESWCDHGCT